MYSFGRFFLVSLLLSHLTITTAGRCGDCAKGKNCAPKCDLCCGGMGGIQYCDSSAGRYVCNNGFYSSCYCDRHAVMDIQNVQGCCIWQGGILNMDTDSGVVICNNGSISEICTIQSAPESVASW